MIGRRLALAMAMLLAACGSPDDGEDATGGSAGSGGSPDGGLPSDGIGEIRGNIDGVAFEPAFAGLGEFWAGGTDGMTRAGQVVYLSDLGSLCRDIGRDPENVHALAFHFWDTNPGTYAVVTRSEDEAVGTKAVTVYLAGRQNDDDLSKKHAVSGTVTLLAIVPQAQAPLTETSVAEGTFDLTFLAEANEDLGCEMMCSESECTTVCSCRTKDGEAFTCSPKEEFGVCCNDEVTETQVVTGWFRASYCGNLCICLANEDCPCKWEE